MGKKFKFEFYGWFTVIQTIVSTILKLIPIIGSIPFLGTIIAAYLYAKWKNKSIDRNFVLNIILTEVALILILLVLVVAGIAIAGDTVF